MKYVLVRVDAPRADGDTGGDLEEIATLLKGMEICGACNMESQAHNCVALDAQKLGRRLWRLIERAKARPSTADAETKLANLLKAAEAARAEWRDVEERLEGELRGVGDPPYSESPELQVFAAAIEAAR